MQTQRDATPLGGTTRSRRRLIPLLLLAALWLTGCADLRYYWQSLEGHWQLMRAARPIDQWLADDTVAPALKQRLALARHMRQFAVSELGLPDNASYQRYADLQRRAAVWNVVAAPELSLTLKTWCFPVAGCVGYRGYFHEAEARAQGRALQAEGLEVQVYGVPAYSTLGWMNWAGGDPLLNTFIHYPEGELARLIFHELAHQVLYVQDDTLFNESFATAVERLGGERWLATEGSPVARQEYAALDARRRAFRALSWRTRQRLAAIYAGPEPAAGGRDAQLARKAEALRDFRQDYARLRHDWGGAGAYDAWVAGANNAAFGAQAAYDELVPAFEALFVQEGGNWPRFLEAARRLAHMAPAQRAAALKQLPSALAGD